MEQAWNTLATTLAKCLPSAHEFMLEQQAILQGTTAATLPLNRYSNIIPYDHSLVKLSTHHYINASHINIKHLKPFIVAQSPTHPDFHGPDTTDAFWQLVHEQSIATIVNLAKVEPGFGGASLYFPMEEGESYSTTHYTCRCLQKEKVEEGLIKRRFRLSVRQEKGQTPDVKEEKTEEHRALECNHYHFERWPNYEVATSLESTKVLLELIQQERTTHANATLVHCSGGVGRSGTFVSALSAVEQLEKDDGEGVGLFARLGTIVQSLRDQRHPWMVEGQEQFEFSGRLVSLVCGQNNVEAGKVVEGNVEGRKVEEGEVEEGEVDGGVKKKTKRKKKKHRPVKRKKKVDDC